LYNNITISSHHSFEDIKMMMIVTIKFHCLKLKYKYYKKFIDFLEL
jgi:phage-related protein